MRTMPEYRLQAEAKQGLQPRLARRQASHPSHGLPPRLPGAINRQDAKDAKVSKGIIYRESAPIRG